eukprot:IDg6108t1
MARSSKESHTSATLSRVLMGKRRVCTAPRKAPTLVQ